MIKTSGVDSVPTLRGRPLPASVAAVRERIEQWRGTRASRTRMPEELWAAAVSTAREHGPWAVSRVLRVNYESLKERMGRTEEPTGAEDAARPRFVEVAATDVLGSSDHAGAVLEVTSADGARLVLRLDRCAALDVGAVVAAFRG